MNVAFPAWLVEWCRDELGAVPVESLLRLDQMSEIFGLRLANGAEVVVKARPDDHGRATSCVRVHRYLFDQGFPCAEPLTPATRVGNLSVHAERWRPGGEMLRGDSPAIAVRFARLLAQLMDALTSFSTAPPLPNPYWVRWDHDGDGIFPDADFLDRRDQSLVPGFVTDAALRIRARLNATKQLALPRMLGHADWETQNLRWQGYQPWAVHDWDSLAWLPEAAIVGAASGAFASAEVPTLAPLASSVAFLDAYCAAHDRRFSTEETEIAWAASLWLALHNARAQALFERPPVAVAAVESQASQRLALAGA